MTLNKKNLYAFMSLFIGIAGFFYFDKGIMAGTDNAWYFDLAYLVHQGGKFTVDYVDYRIPVFAWCFSWLYGFDFSDFINRYIAVVLVYFVYVLIILKISLNLTKSLAKSIFIAIITFLTISARGLDDSRNILQPLFHHVLELSSLLIVLKSLGQRTDKEEANTKQLLLMVLGGALAGWAFIGRQVHLFPILLMIFFYFYSYRQSKQKARSIRWMSLMFFGGLLISLSVIVLKFIAFDAESLKLYKMWLVELPQLWHNPRRLMTRGILIGLLEFRNISLPLFFMTYFFTGICFLRNSMSFFGKKDSLIILRCWFRIHQRQLLLLAALLAMYAINVMPTGIGPARYEAPLITIYACLCAFLMKEMSLWLKNVKLSYKIVLLLPLIANLAMFSFAEAKSYEVSNKNINDQSRFYNYQIAAALKNAMTKRNQTVLVLGLKPLVCRLAKYKPFMGFNGDLYLLALEKLNNEKLLMEIEKNLQEVNVICRLEDYPNIKNTQLQSKIDNYIVHNFVISQKINGQGYSTVIYVRKQK